MTCPFCKAQFKDDECHTRRDVIGGMFYHEAPIITTCPKCEEEFNHEQGNRQSDPASKEV